MTQFHGDPYRPQSGFMKWMESRLPIVGLMYEAGVSFPTPRNLNYWWTFGGILMLCLVVQLLSGIVLAMHYTPHADMAFDSVEHIMRDVNYGWLLRYMHANGGSMFFIAVYIHMFRGMYYGSHKAPREILWILGVVLYLLMMATAFMGYVLPWGQMSFWGATVITSLFSAIPIVGDTITQFLWGGYAVDSPTLNRFYSLHYLLPFMIAGRGYSAYLGPCTFRATTTRPCVNVKTRQDTLTFHPFYTVKDGFAVVVFILFFALILFYAPNSMGEPDNYIEANPLLTPPHIVPEWYFLPFYAILRAVPDKLGGRDGHVCGHCRVVCPAVAGYVEGAVRKLPPIVSSVFLDLCCLLHRSWLSRCQATRRRVCDMVSHSKQFIISRIF